MSVMSAETRVNVVWMLVRQRPFGCYFGAAARLWIGERQCRCTSVYLRGSGTASKRRACVERDWKRVSTGFADVQPDKRKCRMQRAG